MPDVRADRGAYLDRVAARLGLPDERARDVLDELEGHLSESTQGFVDQGMTIEQAERQSIARLGDPDALADGLRRAQQSRRRLLAAAGAGVVRRSAASSGATSSRLAVSIVAGVLSLAIVSTAVSWLQLSVAGWGQWGDEVSIPFAAFVAGYAGRRLVLTVAWKSARRVDADPAPDRADRRRPAGPPGCLRGSGRGASRVDRPAALDADRLRGRRHARARRRGGAHPEAAGSLAGHRHGRGDGDRDRHGLRDAPDQSPPGVHPDDVSTDRPPATDVLGDGWLDQQSSTGLGFVSG